ncbi:MAG: hypothetical protein ACTTIW_02155 [Porphyromonas sp.]
MKPWVHTEDKDDELRQGAALTASVAVCGLAFIEKVPPLRGSKRVETINPELAPWAMQECRPCRALRHLSQSIPLLF